jgi:hypothetical protein
MRALELWPEPQVRRERSYIIDVDAIVLMSEGPGGVWYVEFSSGSYLDLTEEYDQMLAAWRVE